MKKHILIFCMLFSCLSFYNSEAQINYQWAKSIGSSATDIGKDIAVDGAGNIYVAGQFGGNSNFNPFGISPAYLSKSGLFDCFIAKYSADGNNLWVNSVRPSGISSFSLGTSIDVDGSGNVYLIGSFIGTIGFSNSSTDSLTSAGGLDCFFAKYNANGVFQWAKRFGGLYEDTGSSIAVDGLGTGVYLTGYFKNAAADFAGFSSIDGTLLNSGDKDIFISKYDSNGSFIWAKGIGSSGEDMGVALDANNTYLTITGSFQYTADFNPGTTPVENRTAFGSKDVFVVKYFLDGTFGWAWNFGNSGLANSAHGTGIAMDNSNVYLTGVFKGSIEIEPGTPIPAKGKQDIFFAQLGLNQTIAFAHPIGSSYNGSDSATSAGIAVDGFGSIYLTGAFEGKADFNPAGGDTLESNGKGDIFLAKYDITGSKKWAKKIGMDSADIAFGIAVDNAENVYLTGAYQGTVNFDPGAGLASRTSESINASDIFIARYKEGTASITGTVTLSGNGDTITTGTNYAKLYTHTTGDGNAAMHLVETVEINQGTYTFNDVCAGYYFVLASADNFIYSIAAPTYYGDTTHWEGADSILAVPNLTSYANISLKEYSLLNGSATLSGKVEEGMGFDRGPGDPIPGTSVGLEGDPGSIKANTITDVDGYYKFENVPVGDYKIYVNIPGLPMASTHYISVTAADSFPNLNFVADSGAIRVPTSTAIAQIPTLKTKMQIYPNPHKGITTIEFTNTEAGIVKLELFNLLGEKVAELLNEQKQAGIVKYKFNASNLGLKAGVYLMNLKVGDEISSKKIVQIE